MTQTMMKTAELCRVLNLPYYTLIAMIRYGRVAKPAKDSSGDYVWSEADVAAVRAILATRRAQRAQPKTTVA